MSGLLEGSVLPLMRRRRVHRLLPACGLVRLLGSVPNSEGFNFPSLAASRGGGLGLGMKRDILRVGPGVMLSPQS